MVHYIYMQQATVGVINGTVHLILVNICLVNQSTKIVLLSNPGAHSNNLV